MKMKHKSTALLFTTMLFASPVYAQAPGPDDSAGNSPSSAQSVASGDARDQADAVLRAKGSDWTPGYNKDLDRFIAIGSATIKASAAGSAFDFGEARAMAFDEAMLDAKKSMAESMGIEVSGSIESFRASKRGGSRKPTPPTNSGPTTMGDKMNALANSYIDDALREQGIEPGKETTKVVKEITGRSDFKAGIQAAATAELCGVYAWKTFEEIGNGKRGKIAVIAMCSAKSKQMALAMLGDGEAPHGKAKVSNYDYVSDLDLLYKFGVMQRTNDKGELTLLSFGQATAESDDEWDIEDAEAYADDAALLALRMFAGEAVLAQRDGQRGQSLKRFADKSEEYTNTSMRKAAISSVSDKLSMPGLNVLKRTKVTHPLAPGHPIAVHVYEWKLSSARDMADLKKSLSDIGGSSGGKGVTGNSNSGVGGSNTGEGSGANRDGEGNSGSSDSPDDDDT
jgi:hypothetical protein